MFTDNMPAFPDHTPTGGMTFAQFCVYADYHKNESWIDPDADEHRVRWFDRHGNEISGPSSIKIIGLSD